MIKYDLGLVLLERFPVFSKTNDNDDIYLLYGSFGSFFVDLINLMQTGKCEPRHYFYANIETLYENEYDIEGEMKNIFYFVDELYETSDKEIIDVLNTCILEAMIGNDYSYNLAREYLNKDTYNHFLDVSKRVV